MRRSTAFVLRHRGVVLGVWVLLLALGGLAASNLGSLLSNRFSVPGSESERGLNLLRDRLHERVDGAFTLVAQARGGTVNVSGVEGAAQRGAGALPHGRAGPALVVSPRLAYVQINTSLENAKATDRTSEVRQAIGQVPGSHLYLTGFPAINHDTKPLYSEDLTRGERIALPIALA